MTATLTPVKTTSATVTAAITVLTAAQCADALFAASLAYGSIPARSAVADTVTTMIKDLGVEDCAAIVAGEYGDHPEVAVIRMRRVRELVADLPTLTVWLPSTDPR